MGKAFTIPLVAWIQTSITSIGKLGAKASTTPSRKNTGCPIAALPRTLTRSPPGNSTV